MNFLSGKKAYLIAGAGALATFAHLMGWLDDGVYQTICGLLGAGGLAALRAGVAASEANTAKALKEMTPPCPIHLNVGAGDAGK